MKSKSRETIVRFMPRHIALWHAYVIRCIIGIQWVTLNEDITDALRLYLEDVTPNEEDKVFILDALRDKTRNNLKRELKEYFKVFRTDKHVKFDVPEELNGIVKLNKELVLQLKEIVSKLNHQQTTEKNMNAKESVPQGVGQVEATPSNTLVSDLGSAVDHTTLTLENFQAKMGKRFRMTASQKSRNLTREAALQEFLAGFSK